jgi:polyhydroxyalkanoate synthesis regulator phasin
MADEKKKSDLPVDLAGIMEDVFLMGIGVAEVTKDKVTELANEMIERGKMSESDAKKVADKINEVASDQQEAIRKTVTRETDKVIKESNVASKDDVDDLKAQVSELKEMIAKMQGGGAAPAAGE